MTTPNPNPNPNPTPTPLASTAMEAAEEIYSCNTSTGNNAHQPIVPKQIAAIIQKHFQPLLAKVEGERDALQNELVKSAQSHPDGPTKKTYESLLIALRADLAAANGENALLSVNLKNWKESAEILEAQREQLRADLEAKEAALNQALKKLRHVKKETETGVIYWETYAFESELMAIESLASRADKGGAT